MQVQEFNIEIKNEKIKASRIITFLIVTLNVLIFVSRLFNVSKRSSALAALGFIAVYIIYRLYMARKRMQPFFFDEWIYFILMILWNDIYPMTILCMFLFVSYTVSIQKIIYSFDTSFVTQKNFPWKKYHWNELSNVILKDNLLTLDFKNNKLMQAEIINADINEAAFNTFAKKQLGVNSEQNG